MTSLPRKLGKVLLSEFLGTAILLSTVIGSGIMAERLSAGNVGLTLLANTLATVLILYVLIEVFGPESGAYFNPIVSIVMAFRGQLVNNGSATLAVLFVVAQLGGALVGAGLANAMFDLNIIQVSTKLRTGPGQWLAEAVATAGLVFVVLRAPPGKASGLVACYIGAAYWFTASTSFANPAAVLGRMFSNSFAGIAPHSALPFVAAQCVGGAVGGLLSSYFDPTPLA
ncbi:MAG: MIP/aquaporin family protein [Rhodoferax sp.]